MKRIKKLQIIDRYRFKLEGETIYSQAFISDDVCGSMLYLIRPEKGSGNYFWVDEDNAEAWYVPCLEGHKSVKSAICWIKKIYDGTNMFVEICPIDGNK